MSNADRFVQKVLSNAGTTPWELLAGLDVLIPSPALLLGLDRRNIEYAEHASAAALLELVGQVHGGIRYQRQFILSGGQQVVIDRSRLHALQINVLEWGDAANYRIVCAVQDDPPPSEPDEAWFPVTYAATRTYAVPQGAFQVMATTGTLVTWEQRFPGSGTSYSESLAPGVLSPVKAPAITVSAADVLWWRLRL